MANNTQNTVPTTPVVDVPEKIRVEVAVSARTAQGAEVGSITIGLNVSPSLLPVATSCAQMVLVQPASPEKGSYGVYVGAKGGLFGALVANYWPREINADGKVVHEERTEVLNVAIAARSLGKNAGYAPILNKTGVAVYNFMLVNGTLANPMGNVILSAKGFIHAAIGHSGLCPVRITTAEVTADNSIDVVSIELAELPQLSIPTAVVNK